jgi:hypothetical protein
VGLEAILAGVAALIAGAGAIYITIHEVRRRERKVTRQEIHDLTNEIEALRHLLLEQRRYIYSVATMLVDHGFDVPTPPAPSFDPDEY